MLDKMKQKINIRLINLILNNNMINLIKLNIKILFEEKLFFVFLIFLLYLLNFKFNIR
jgi:hypothetical protein